LTVTGAYLKPTGDLIFHQMILDRVESDEYVLQNTLFSNELAPSQNLPLLRIDRRKRYYGMFNMYRNPNGVINRPNGEFLLLTNEYCNSMNEEEWYLLPKAYSITLTPSPMHPSRPRKFASTDGDTNLNPFFSFPKKNKI
jgi:hypothetical protein